MVKVAIVGASGYTGLELLKLLIRHPRFQITYIATSGGGEDLFSLHPALRGVYTAPVKEADAEAIAKEAQLAFLALPHKTSMGLAKRLLDLGMKVVDLSADYRLRLETYEAYYCPHEDTAHLKEAVYGLPEYYRESIKKCRLVANPGCYPTVSLLALLPFADLIDASFPIFIDAKSGVSGAGKKCGQKSHFVSINENHFAYNPLSHRHGPEISEKMQMRSGRWFDINFVPHLLPLTRGMLVSCYLRLKKRIDPLDYLKAYYEKEPFVRIFDDPVDIKSASGTHFCDLFAKTNGQNLFLSGAIDNLLRGASSQAVANANLICGFEEKLALPDIAYVP